jgi:hypothetical protein
MRRMGWQGGRFPSFPSHYSQIQGGPSELKLHWSPAHEELCY